MQVIAEMHVDCAKMHFRILIKLQLTIFRLTDFPGTQGLFRQYIRAVSVSSFIPHEEVIISAMRRDEMQPYTLLRGFLASESIMWLHPESIIIRLS